MFETTFSKRINKVVQKWIRKYFGPIWGIPPPSTNMIVLEFRRVVYEKLQLCVHEKIRYLAREFLSRICSVKSFKTESLVHKI